MAINREQAFAALPPCAEGEWLDQIKTALSARREKLVVLDDDPTGTQTVYDIPVLTEWSVPSLQQEFANDLPCFYLLTNSRSVGPGEAEALNLEIAKNLKRAAEGRSFRVVSRSDSTLRGHFPLETDVLAKVLGPYDGVLLIPYFEAGGRYTIDDIHYVADGDQLVPAAETAFASDASFGYRHSGLREWVEEKTQGRVLAKDVESISIDQIRYEGPSGVAAYLETLSDGKICVVNAAAPSDLEVVALACYAAESQGKRFLFRTGAQFVSTRLGLASGQGWRPEVTGETDRGGLVIVGSHVPKSSAQLNVLLDSGRVEPLELPVERLLKGESGLIADRAARVDALLSSGKDVVVYTSRALVTGADAESSLAVARQVSAALVELVRRLQVSPRYLLAKGGITSSDLATKALGVKRAIVKGPVVPGVPVWETESGTRFPGMPYIVFPGNVGSEDSVLEVVDLFRRNTDETEV